MDRNPTVDNFNNIGPFLQFTDDGDTFYHIMVMQRGKDFDDEKDDRIVRDFYITSKEHFEKESTYIKELCHSTGARAYININARSFNVTAAKQLKTLSDFFSSNGGFKKISRSFRSALTKSKAPGAPKRWFINIDEEEMEAYQSRAYFEILGDVYKEQGNGNLLIEVHGKNGVHIFCTPFNPNKFSELCEERGVPIPEVKKISSYTNLYIP